MEFGKSKLYVCHYPFSNLPEDDEFDVEITVRVRVFFKEFGKGQSKAIKVD